VKSHLPTAAAVLAVGKLEQSPSAKTLEYLLCTSVPLLTSTKPAASVIPDDCWRKVGADCGGEICSRSYCE